MKRPLSNRLSLWGGVSAFPVFFSTEIESLGIPRDIGKGITHAEVDASSFANRRKNYGRSFGPLSHFCREPT